MFSLLNRISTRRFTPASVFMISSLIVNGGNYGFNLILGRTLGPTQFAEAGLILSLLLVVSLFGMTFQLTATRFAGDTRSADRSVQHWMLVGGFLTGTALTLLVIAFLQPITVYFQLSNPLVLVVFSLGFPFYCYLSVQRGVFQGKQQFIGLSTSYQKELWVKILSTFLLLVMFPSQSSLILAFAIVFSIITSISSVDINIRLKKLPKPLSIQILKFFGFTIAYELVQILINYGDLIMVKHYFDNTTAGLYTSISLVGRMIYFATWVLVMLLIPKVVERKKKGLPVTHLLYRNILLISGLSTIIVLFTGLFPRFSIMILFGEAFLPISGLLWKYALATSFFALSNLVIYYFISIDRFWPVLLAGVFALAQLFCYQWFHNSLEEVVMVQVVSMGTLLVVLFVILKIHR